MQLTIEHIEEELAGEVLVPGRLARFRTFLAALYSLRASEMQQIEALKPKIWLALREHKKSDAATDREWDLTEKGQRQTFLRWELRKIEKLSSAIASQLRVLEGEARNQI